MRLVLRDSRSLKEKRQMLRQVKDRLSNDFNVSVAEVDHQDLWQLATLGVAMVSADAEHLQSALQQVVEAVRKIRPAELVDHEMEILP